jgi:hypothetical protein
MAGQRYKAIPALPSQTDRATGGNKFYDASQELQYNKKDLMAALRNLGRNTNQMEMSNPVQPQPYSFTSSNTYGPFPDGTSRRMDANTPVGNAGKQPYSIWNTLGSGARSLLGKDNMAGNALNLFNTGYGIYRDMQLAPKRLEAAQLGNDLVRQQMDILAQNKEFAQQDQSAIRANRRNWDTYQNLGQSAAALS